MHRALRTACLLLCVAMFVVPAYAAGQFASNAAALSAPSTQSAHASLKVSLRQQDDTAFSGLATIRLTSAAGAEITGRKAESDDQVIFTDLAPGQYVLQAVAPGFTSVSETSTSKRDGNWKRFIWC